MLLDFVAWATTHYPAERYGLVRWNHGTGWDPLEMDRIARAVGAPAYDAREASVRSATPPGNVFFRTALERIFQLPSPAERAICTDDGSGHALDTVELGKVLAQVVDRIGRPLRSGAALAGVLAGVPRCVTSPWIA